MPVKYILLNSFKNEYLPELVQRSTNSIRNLRCYADASHIITLP